MISPARQRAALRAIEWMAHEFSHDPETANPSIDREMRRKLEPCGIVRGYTYETIRRARTNGKVGRDLWLALLAYFDADEDNEASFMDRFRDPTGTSAAVAPIKASPPPAAQPTNARRFQKAQEQADKARSVRAKNSAKKHR